MLSTWLARLLPGLAVALGSLAFSPEALGQG